MLILLGGAVWLGVYAWDQGFTKKWRGLIAKELAKHGLRAEIGRLTLDPVEGLTARDVKLFDMLHRDQHLADIDRISLDVDVARLVNQEDFLRTLHLQKADVSLPVDPGDPKSEWLTVADLNARLVFQQDRIEIARAEDGTDFPAYVIDSRRSAWHHLRDLADLSGFDLWIDRDGKLVKRFISGEPDLVFDAADIDKELDALLAK